MTLAQKTTLSRTLTQISYWGLLLLLTLWFMWISPAASDNPWVIWLIHLLPLAAFAGVIIKGTPRGHAWLCFVILVYFMEAVLAALTPHSQIFGILYVVLVTTLFISAMLYARWYSQWQRSLNQPAAD